ncbi:MAG: HAD-IB family hydrolase [Gammaproteobacteria bacterium HGW-Gammaproteobacteria-1]|jgi:HAD superfamily hydrolase (TIGR01490 family)|nr:MAG: HAD-IB family hydrolase [Gammaproteobacteria bacterium HGW-Gammaproteobacteria-1]
MTLAIFDLDNTLLGGDSDHLWGRFLVEQGIVDGEYYEHENNRFYEEYKAGTLDIRAYQRFALAPLVGQEPETLAAWHRRYMAEKIAAIMLPAARTLLDWHLGQGHFPLVITATNSFITAPIVAALGVEDYLATEPELVGGRYTGDVTGIPTFQHGKVQRLAQWLEQTGHNLAGAWFYSDSHNDLPLLEQVDHPVAVDPDDTLRSHAEARGWDIITLRRGERPLPLARDEVRGTMDEEAL